MTSTRFYHAVLGGLTGLAFTIGDSWLFAPAQSDQLFLTTDHASLVLLSPIAPSVAAYLSRTIIEPRFSALAADVEVV
jgi:hypothetical protein